MTAATPLAALVIETAALTQALASLPDSAWTSPTRCRPWDARALLAHVRVAVARVPQALAEPAPPAADVSALAYYRPDERFSPATNTDRIVTAQAQASDLPAPAILAELDDLRSAIVGMCTPEPPDRVIRTRHGDAMLLTEFLKTRVIEVAVHGFDLADALAQPSWLTPAAADLLQDLLLGPSRTAPDPERFLRAATGRATDPDLLARLQSRPLTLG
ncbi:maleylpyruvate isomerase N-terminal domain-containing protein [Actinoplanes sp. KI2]|uniref:maleylpyruvate isomerase N-terminal domain-containing protein n=1 Tax=Actinoplanes sp. KI2 TaxID=2983315 RepID=UPI0021D5D639|nr:maleylpyruvate isomerase N-terminal domain-containing protein [Actinoplanes sp. KI2]MCU7723159.1 maleylpyruvate isomerase N-terminal domain-containing protein [Actinoplanes sp. KI2]